MTHATLAVEHSDGVALVTLIRPDNANSINMEMAKDLMQAFIRLSADRAVRAVLLRGAGNLFCAGGDLAEMCAHTDDACGYLTELTGYLHGAIARIASMDAPVVAAVQGAAAGAGFALAAACDLTVADEKAKFLLSYTRAGLVLDGSSSWYLPRLVGLKRALELALTNRSLAAAEALDWGIVNRVCPADALGDEALSLARSLAEGPTGAYGSVKRMLRGSLQAGLCDQMDLETMLMAQAGDSADGREGMAAFFEKRPPAFGGGR
jgi:2-(1,2-epoxy-1,2-dihydrophenyl)acetyl-CoA isomerase